MREKENGENGLSKYALPVSGVLLLLLAIDGWTGTLHGDALSLFLFLVKTVVTASCIWRGATLWKRGCLGWAVTLFVMALLFNPLFHVIRLQRETWAWLDVFTAIILFVNQWAFYETAPRTERSSTPTADVK